MKQNILALALILGACAAQEKKPEVPAVSVNRPSASIEAQQVAAAQGTPLVTEVAFAAGRDRLGKADGKKINRFIDESLKQGDVEKIQVISWADEEYPSVNTKKLSQSQIDLAHRRGEEIHAYIRRHKFSDIELINMARRPNALQKLVQSDDYRIKRALEVSGIPNTDTSVKEPSKSGHTMVIVYMNQ